MFAERVNILGTEYAIKNQTDKENPKMAGNDGLCEWWDKSLILDLSQCDGSYCMDNIAEYKKSVLRHEITHAFFHESGIDHKYGRDEVIVQWIALQIPKMVKAMREAGCL